MTIHNLTINDEDIFFDIDGTEYCYEAHLLSYLLYHEIVFQYFNNNSLLQTTTSHYLMHMLRQME